MPGLDVEFELEGDGTLAMGLHTTSLNVKTMSDGSALCVWYEYPSYRPRRGLSSVVRARADAEGTLDLKWFKIMADEVSVSR